MAGLQALAEVPSAKVQRIDEVLDDPQIQAHGMLREQQHPRYGTLTLANLQNLYILVRHQPA